MSTSGGGVYCRRCGHLLGSTWCYPSDGSGPVCERCEGALNPHPAVPPVSVVKWVSGCSNCAALRVRLAKAEAEAATYRLALTEGRERAERACNSMREMLAFLRNFQEATEAALKRKEGT